MGWGLRKEMYKLPQFFTPCNYDNRSDIPESDEPNAEIARKMDELIVSNDYRIYTVCDSQTNPVEGII